MILLDSSINVFNSPVLFKSTIRILFKIVFWACAPSHESWSLFLDLQVLHSVILLAHGDKFWRGLPSYTIARYLIDCLAAFVKYSSTRFSEPVVMWESLGTKCCPLSCLQVFQCNQLTLSHKGWWREIASARIVILYLSLFAWLRPENIPLNLVVYFSWLFLKSSYSSSVSSPIVSVPAMCSTIKERRISTRITKSSCTCDCGRGSDSVDAFFFLFSFFLSSFYFLLSPFFLLLSSRIEP